MSQVFAASHEASERSVAVRCLNFTHLPPSVRCTMRRSLAELGRGAPFGPAHLRRGHFIRASAGEPVRRMLSKSTA